MKIEIKTDNLTLCVPGEEQFERYWGLLNELQMWQPQNYPEKLEYAKTHEAFLARGENFFTEDGAEFAVIGERERYVGRCGFRRTEKGAEFYYNYCMDSWGHGYSYEAGKAALEYFFKNFSHDSYYMNVDERDAAAVRVSERLGFVKAEDGLFVQNRK